MMRFFILFLLPTILLSGCTTSIHQNTVSHSTPEKSKSAHLLTHWELSGAVAAKHAKKAWSASLDWIQYNKNEYRISLYGPMGGHAITIEKKSGHIVYQDHEKIVHAKNESSLLYRETGQSLPIHHLIYWIKGIKSPDTTANEQHDADGRLQRLSQDGYDIQYQDYQNVSGYVLPRKIQITSKDTLIKIVIKAWDVNA